MPGKKTKKKGHKNPALTENCVSGSGDGLESCAPSDLARDHSIRNDNAIPAGESTFQQELDWCIGQLELGLLRPEASKAQKEQSRKYIKTLQSSKNPLPRKRQLMRQLFGDYRAKMKSKPLAQKLSLGSTDPCITTTDKQKLLSSGKFYKPCMKHNLHSSLANPSPFMFMFDVSDSS